MRINYTTILYDLRPKALFMDDIPQKYEFTDSKIMLKGHEMQKNDMNIRNRNFGDANAIANYNISKAASQKKPIVDHKYFSGDERYSCPTLDIAMQFAIRMGDKPLVRALQRLSKYDEQIYNDYYEAYETAYKMSASGERRSERLGVAKTNLKELQFEERHAKTKGEKRRISKKIIAQKKEIEEIISKGKKVNKGYAKKYVKQLRKAVPEARMHNLYSEKYSKAKHIITDISTSLAITQNRFDIDGINKVIRKEEYYKIDDARLEKLFSELFEKYYNDNNQQKNL